MRINGTNLGLIDKVGQTYSGEQLRLILTELRKRIGTVETSSTTTTVIGGGGGSGALSNEAYVTIGASAALTNERALTGSSRISVTDNGANSTVVINAIGAALTKADDTNVTLALGGSPTTALVNAASLTLGWAGQLSVARGGTGAASALAAFNALSPLTTLGDLLTHNGTNNIRFGIGSSGQVLTVAAGAISWATPSVSAATTEAYVTIGNTAGLSDERALAVSNDRLTISDGGAGNTVALNANMGSTNWDWTRGITVFGAADEIELDLQGIAGQTSSVPVFRVKDNAVTPLRMFEVTPDGTVTVSSTSSALTGVKFQVRVPTVQSSNIAQIVQEKTPGNNYTAWSVGSTGSSVYGDILAHGAAVVRLQINQGSGQSVDMFRIRNTAGTIDLVKVDSAGVFNLAGTTSGIISFGLQAAAGTYNFNLPTGAGSAGQPLLSGGGGAAAQTYGTLGVPGGGTGITSLATGNIPIGAGASAFTALAPGTANAVVRSDGTAWRRNLDETAGTAHIDFGTAKAIAMACDNGTTLPGTATIGQWYLLTPAAANRSVLYQYSGAAWIPKWSLGAVAMFVDFDAGTDTQSLGGTTGAGAFKTIQFALNQIPLNLGGDVTVTIAARAASTSYGEAVYIGNANTGRYSITLQGAATPTNLTTTSGGTQGTLTTQPTVTVGSDVTGTFPAGTILSLVLDGGAAETRIVDTAVFSAGSTTLTLCGGILSVAPDTNDTIAKYPLSTVTSSILIFDGAVDNIIVNDISFDAGGGLSLSKRLSFYRCKWESSAAVILFGIITYSDVQFIDCVFLTSSSGAICINCQPVGFVSLRGCYIARTSGSGGTVTGVRLDQHSTVLIRNGTVITGAFYRACEATAYSVLQFISFGSEITPFIKGPSTAINMNSSWLSSYASCQISGATTNIDRMTIEPGGIVQSINGSMFNQTAALSVTGTPTNTTLFGTGTGTLSIPANTAAVGKGKRIMMWGVYSTDATPGNATFRLTIGGVEIITTGSLVLPASMTNKMWKLDLMLVYRTVGSSGGVMASGSWSHQETGVGAGPLTEWQMVTATPITVNTLNTAAIDVQCSMTNSGNTITSHIAAVEVLN